MGRFVLVAFMVVSLSACEGIARRNIEVTHGAGAPDSAAVAKAVGEFGASRSFTCREQPAPQVLDCTSYGPRYLSVEAKGNSTLVELTQPYPWTTAGAPRLYTETVDAFTQYMSGRFGANAQVVK
jgi:hypothetical protein